MTGTTTNIRTQINMLNTHKSTFREQSDILVPFLQRRN